MICDYCDFSMIEPFYYNIDGMLYEVCHKCWDRLDAERRGKNKFKMNKPVREVKRYHKLIDNKST